MIKFYATVETVDESGDVWYCAQFYMSGGDRGVAHWDIRLGEIDKSADRQFSDRRAAHPLVRFELLCQLLLVKTL